MTLAVRRATAGDADAVLAVDHIADRADRVLQRIYAGECIVAIDGVVVGFVILTHSFFEQPFVELVVVAPSARGRGIGRALVEHCMAAHGAEKLWSSANASNRAMQALLAKAGFVRSGQIDNLDRGDPELVFLRLPQLGAFDTKSMTSPLG